MRQIKAHRWHPGAKAGLIYGDGCRIDRGFILSYAFIVVGREAMSVRTRILISGISPYCLGRIPGPAPGMAVVLAAATAPRPRMTADVFFRKLGGSREAFWSLIGAGKGFNPTDAGGPAELGIAPIEIRFKRKVFLNCEAVQAHADLLALKKKPIAEAVFAFTTPKLINEKTEEITPGQFQHSAALSFALDLKGSFINFPDWSWSGRTKRQSTALTRFNLNLLVHELGHFIVAGQILSYAKRSFTGFGTTAKKAENDTRKQIDVTSLHDDVVRISDEYDLHTGHGSDQSEGPNNTFNTEGRKSIPFPGGEDVVLDLRCRAK